MRLIGCVNMYQDASFLRRSLAALRRQVDILVCVDGAYAEFPAYGPGPVSTDGSVEVAAECADILILPPAAGGVRRPWPDEIAKRSSYLVGREGDWYFVVDADEVVEGEVDRAALASKDDWTVMLRRVDDTIPPYGIHRCFRHRAGIRYHGTHHAVHVGDKLVHPETVKDVLPGVVLAHYQMHRDRDRVERKGEYYRKLAVAEGAFRRQNGL